MGYGSDSVFGVRILVSLLPDVKLSKRLGETKTVTSAGGVEYTYNMWDINYKQNT